MCVRILAARCARVLRRLPPSEQEGAGKAGCALHPRCRVQKCTKNRTRAYRFSGGNPSVPALWCTGLFRALPGDRAFLPPSSPRSLLLKNLTPASGRQDHTASPSATTAFVICCLRLPPPPPPFRHDPPPPLSSGETRGAKALICPTG